MEEGGAADIRGRKASVTRAVPKVLVSKTSRSCVMNLGALLATPALLIRTSTCPNSFSTDVVAVEMEEGSAISSWIRDADPAGFCAWSCAKALGPFSRERLPMITWYLEDADVMALADSNPMPLLALCHRCSRLLGLQE